MNFPLARFALTRSTAVLPIACTAYYRPLHRSAVLAAHNLLMPALSPTMTQGSIVKWHVNQGAKFSAGDVLFEVETDKAQMEVDAQDDGVLAKVLVPAGSMGVAVNSVIAILAEEGEDLSSINVAKLLEPATPTLPSDVTTPTSASAPSHSDPSPKPTEEQTNPAPVTSSRPIVPRHPHLAPAVSHLIHLYNLDATTVSKIPVSGPQNRLLKGDILTYVRQHKLSPRRVTHPPPQIVNSPSFTPVIIDIPLSRSSGATRRALIALKQSSHLTANLVVDGTPIFTTCPSNITSHTGEVHIHIDGVHRVPRPEPVFSLKTKQQELDFYQYLAVGIMPKPRGHSPSPSVAVPTPPKTSQDIFDYLGGVPRIDDSRFHSILRVQVDKVTGISTPKDVTAVVAGVRSALESALM